jgi:hypothetical protein
MINILNDAEIRMIWPHEAIFTGLGFLRHPNTIVSVDRGKKECVAVYGESFSWGDSMDSPYAAEKEALMEDYRKGTAWNHWRTQMNIEKYIELDHFAHTNDLKSNFILNDKFNPRNDNFSFRMNNNLGGQLTRKLDTDYYFSCVPGQGTTTTLYGLENSIEDLSSKYDKVYVVFQMTDPSRDFGMGDKDVASYIKTEEPHQMKIINLMENETKYDVDEFFLLYEQIYADRFKELGKEYPNCEFVVWKNFTRWCGADFGNTITIEDVMVEHYWKLSNKDGECPIPIIGPIWWDEFRETIKSVPKLDTEYIMKEVELGEKSWEWMENTDNIYEGDRWGGTGSYHPSPLGHRVWAEYIIKHIKEHNGKD